MTLMNDFRTVVAILSATVIAVSGVCWGVWHNDHGEMPAMSDIVTSLQWNPTIFSDTTHEESAFREEQLNKLRMLKKRFDSLESSVAKVDDLEKSVERMDGEIKILADSLSVLQSENSNKNNHGVEDSDSSTIIPITIVKSDETIVKSDETAKAVAVTGDQCQFNKIEGSWSQSWRWLNHGCETDLNDDEVGSCLSRFEKIVFLGDSQMYHLYRTFVRSMTSKRCEEIKSGGRCGQLKDYYGLQPVEHEKLVRPNPQQLEGPIRYGLDHPGCTDCSGCDLGTMSCNGTTPSDTLQLEYVALEFARDVELQSTEASTTQENIALYLARSRIRPSVVVLNVGLHDSQVLEDGRVGAPEPMSIQNYAKTCDLYKENLDWLITLLRKHLPYSTFIFLTTSPKNMDYFRVNGYANPLIEHMNRNAQEVMEAHRCKTMDVYPLIGSERGHELFTDEVHAHEHGGAYYKAVRYLLLRRMCEE